MTVRITTIEGKKVKLYPAFNTNAHAHDIEFRRNRLMNEIYASIFPETDEMNRYPRLTSDEVEKAERLVSDLGEILGWIDFPVTYLPYNLYTIAKETILWAGEARGARR